MSTQTHQQEVIIQGKIGMLITVRILNASNKCIASTTEFHAYQKLELFNSTHISQTYRSYVERYNCENTDL